MVLDGVLAEPDVTWLGLARDKVAAFTNPAWCLAPDGLPRTTVGGVVRPFPDAFPIALAPDGSCLFLYLVTAPLPTTFRTLLMRHLALLSVRPSCGLRLLVPPVLSDVRDAYQTRPLAPRASGGVGGSGASAAPPGGAGGPAGAARGRGAGGRVPARRRGGGRWERGGAGGA